MRDTAAPPPAYPLDGQRKAVARDALVPRGLVAPFIYGYSHPFLFVGLTAVGVGVRLAIAGAAGPALPGATRVARCGGAARPVGAAPGSPGAHASVIAVTAQDRLLAPHRARGSGSYVEQSPP